MVPSWDASPAKCSVICRWVGLASGSSSPIIAGLLLTHYIAAGSGLTAYRIGFIVKSTSILAGLFLLRGVREPQRSTQPSLTGAFRSIRQLVAAQGASFLGQGGMRRR
jgi:hypothetical protein